MIHRRLLQLSDGIRLLLFAQGAISFFLTGLIIAQMLFLSRIIHAVFMDRQTLHDVTVSLIILLALILARAGFIALHQIVSQHGAIRIKTGLRRQLFARLLDAGPAVINEQRTGELTAALTEGLDKIDAYYARYLPRALHVMIAPLLIALFVLSIDPLSGAILLFTGPLIPVFMWLIGTMAEKRTQKQWGAMSRMSAHFLDMLQGLTTLKLFGKARDQERDIRRISNRYRLTTMGVLKIAFLSGLVLELAASLSTAIVAVQIGIRLVEGHMPFQLGLFVLLLAPEFYLPFRQLGTEHHAAMEGEAAADRLLVIRNTPVPPAPTRPIAPPTAPSDIRLVQIHYTYPGRDQPALDNLTAQFPSGEITAVVGSSGAGKSTLLHVLCRHVEPDSGSLRAGQIDLLDVDRIEWRRLLAIVPQRPSLFHGTVRDNLRMARPDATHNEIESAARAAEAHDFITRLPDGYDTELGEQAWRLSGGERQRLAIARAFLKDAPVLLMDEPSAHLDPESEERIATAFERLSRDRTVIVIAHRLRTVYRADRILVMDHGRLAEEGTHENLLHQQGMYTRMMKG